MAKKTCTFTGAGIPRSTSLFFCAALVSQQLSSTVTASLLMTTAACAPVLPSVLQDGDHAASLFAEAYSANKPCQPFEFATHAWLYCSPGLPCCGLCASSSVLCRPLYLNQQRLLRLNQLWVASAFDFDSPTFHDASGGSAWRAAHYW